MEYGKTLMARNMTFGYGRLRNVETAVGLYDEQLIKRIETTALACDSAVFLSEFGMSLLFRAGLFGECHDIRGALEVHRRAVAPTPTNLRRLPVACIAGQSCLLLSEQICLP